MVLRPWSSAGSGTQCAGAAGGTFTPTAWNKILVCGAMPSYVGLWIGTWSHPTPVGWATMLMLSNVRAWSSQMKCGDAPLCVPPRYSAGQDGLCQFDHTAAAHELWRSEVLLLTPRVRGTLHLMMMPTQGALLRAGWAPLAE